MSDNFESIACPICTLKEFETILTLTPKEFTGKNRGYYNYEVLGCDMQTKFQYAKCSGCNFVTVNPRLSSDYYQKAYNEAKAGQDELKSWRFDGGDLSKLYNTKHKWKKIQEFLLALNFFSERFSRVKNEGQSKLLLLDYGSGDGHTLEIGNVFGLECYGVDIDESRIKNCVAKGLQVTRPELLGTKKFDIVISHSVIEHVNDLNGYLEYISTRMSSGSIFMFDGLHPDLIEIEKKRGRYKHVHPIEHLNLMDKKTLIRICKKFNLRPLSRSLLAKTFLKNRLNAYPLIPHLLRGSIIFSKGYFDAIMIKE